MNMYLMIISSNDNDVIDDIVVNMKMVKATVKTRKKITYFVSDIFLSNNLWSFNAYR